MGLLAEESPRCVNLDVSFVSQCVQGQRSFIQNKDMSCPVRIVGGEAVK